MGFLTTILTSLPVIGGLFSRLLNTVDTITSAIANEKIALINAKTEEERIIIGERIAALQAKQAILVADAQHSSIDLWARAFLAFGPGLLLFKLTGFDKAIGPFFGCVGHTMPGTCTIFQTDAIDSSTWNVIGVVYAFYFVYAGATGVARIVKGSP